MTILLVTWTWFNPDMINTPVYFMVLCFFFMYLPNFMTLTQLNHPGPKLHQSGASAKICASDVQPAGWDQGGYGVWEAVSFAFFLHSMILWLFFAVMDTILINYYKVLQRWTQEHYRQQQRIYHAIAWGLPLITTIILLADHNLGCDGSTVFCFASRRVKNWSYWILNAFTVVEVVIFNFSGNLLVFYDKCSNNSLKETNSLWHVSQRLLVFQAAFAALFGLAEAIVIYTAVKDDDWTEVATIWVQCLLTKGEAACPRPDDDLINVGAWACGNLIPPIWGILLFLFYLSWDDCVSWYEAMTMNWDAIQARRTKAMGWVAGANLAPQIESAAIDDKQTDRVLARDGSNGKRFIRLPTPSPFRKAGSNAMIPHTNESAQSSQLVNATQPAVEPSAPTRANSNTHLSQVVFHAGDHE